MMEISDEAFAERIADLLINNPADWMVMQASKEEAKEALKSFLLEHLPDIIASVPKHKLKTGATVCKFCQKPLSEWKANEECIGG